MSEPDPSDSERERQIAAIVDGARRARPKTSRTLWWVAGIVAAICVVAFVVMIFVEGDTETTASPVRAPARATGGGFAGGLAIGLGVGIAIGFAIARHLSSRDPGPASRASHSSRKSP